MPQTSYESCVTPLIGMVPSDPATMMNAMIEAQEITRETGQVLTVFTVDQQLYRVIVNVKWVYPELFHSFIRRLACLTSFVGCVCVLMANSVLRVRGISMSDAISPFISFF